MNELLNQAAADFNLNEKTSKEVLSTEASEHENEIEIYVVNANIDKVKELAIRYESQEQFGFFSEKTEQKSAASSHRIRETISHNGDEPVVECVHTFKVVGLDGTRNEFSTVVDRETFINFKLIADSRLRKTRYFIPFQHADYVGLNLEVDVMAGGNVTKIDLELPQGKDIDNDSLLEAIRPLLTDDKPLIVRPSDKASKNAVAREAHELFKGQGIENGPFTKES